MRRAATIVALVSLAGLAGPLLAAKAPPAKAAPKKAVAAKTAKASAETFSGESFARVFAKMEIEHSLDKDDQGNPLIYYKLEGYNIGLHTYPGEDGVLDSVSFEAGFEVENPDLEKRMGDWNRKMRYCQAYVRENGVGEIRYDVDLVECGAGAQLEDAIRRFQSLASDFVRHIQPGATD